MRIHLAAGILGLHLLTACHPSNFKGDVATKNSSAPVPKDAPAVPNELPAVPKESPPVPTLPIAPTETTIPAIIPPTPPTDPTPPPAKPETPPSTAIEFGANEIFRIGDGFASATSACVGQVKTYQLSGTTYYFQFEVLEDDTQIDLTIGRICGIDQLDKDTFALINETTKKVELAEKALPKLSEAAQATPWVPYPTFTVNKGIYSVVITSKNIYGHPKIPGVPIDPSKDEYDDFLVGNILLKANRNVRAVKIYTE